MKGDRTGTKYVPRKWSLHAQASDTLCCHTARLNVIVNYVHLLRHQQHLHTHTCMHAHAMGTAANYNRAAKHEDKNTPQELHSSPRHLSFCVHKHTCARAKIATSKYTCNSGARARSVTHQTVAKTM